MNFTPFLTLRRLLLNFTCLRGIWRCRLLLTIYRDTKISKLLPCCLVAVSPYMQALQNLLRQRLELHAFLMDSRKYPYSMPIIFCDEFMQNVNLRFFFFAIMVSLGICRICCVSASLQPALFLYLGHGVYFYTLLQKSISVHKIQLLN